MILGLMLVWFLYFFFGLCRLRNDFSLHCLKMIFLYCYLLGGLYCSIRGFLLCFHPKNSSKDFF